MILCSLEPGLVTLTGLQPHDTDTAFAVIDSLLLHKEMIKRFQVKIPFTDELVVFILNELNNIPIKNPPIQSHLKQLIIELLTQQLKPSIPPAKLPNTQLSPNVISPWINGDICDAWFDTFVAAITDLLNGHTENQLSIATWSRNDLPYETIVSNPGLSEFVEDEQTEWCIPVVSVEHDWLALLAEEEDWPNNIDILVKDYARKALGIPTGSLDQMMKFKFEPPCLKAIQDEDSSEFRERIVDVIACRAYNRLQPHHNNEALKTEKGVWRVYVKKMAPSARLHYVMDGDVVTYVLYTNGDHDKGL